MNSNAFIVNLARSFPSLRQLVPNDPDKWDAGLLLEARGMSTGQQHAAAFVCGVWFGLDDNLRFNLIAAMQWWDSEHLAAFLAWASNPRWP